MQCRGEDERPAGPRSNGPTAPFPANYFPKKAFWKLPMVQALCKAWGRGSKWTFCRLTTKKPEHPVDLKEVQLRKRVRRRHATSAGLTVRKAEQGETRNCGR